jgi:DNA-binding response OmpR family regulator
MTISAEGKSLEGCNILLVEDEYFVAIRLERALVDHGANIVASLSQLDAAYEFIFRNEARADVAILDINLSGKLSFPLADDLALHGVPVIFLSGYDDNFVPAGYRSRPRLQKPVAMMQVVLTIQNLLGLPA